MEYSDTIIMALRKKYESKQLGTLKSSKDTLRKEIQIGTAAIPLYKEQLFHNLCSIMLPETMDDMDYLDRFVKYQNQNRPEVIKTDTEGEAFITFGLLSQEDNENTKNISQRLAKIRADMEKIWKQYVFYDIGEIVADNIPVAWMDFKAFCINGMIYSMLFLFQIEEQAVLGNFHCVFPKYDIWKPAVLKLLTTIQVEGKNNERTAN